jgi:hypothetical protein
MEFRKLYDKSWCVCDINMLIVVLCVDVLMGSGGVGEWREWEESRKDGLLWRITVANPISGGVTS